jgi:branched-chain amino acid aminotransferase
MLEDRVVYLNGDFIAWDRATVHMMSHSFGRASAIFEILSLHDTARGPMIFRLDRHIDRLFTTAGLLDMELPMSGEAFQEAVRDTVTRNGIRRGFIKIVAFYSQIVLDIFPPRKPLDVAVFAVDPAQDLGGLRFPFEKGTAACTSGWRKLDPQTVPIEAKVAANYLNGMIARLEARDRGCDHVVMLDTQGFLAEGATESVFLVKGGRLMTPSTGTVLKSITRSSVLRMAEVIGVETLEGRLPPELLLEAEEIFFSGTPMKVLAVRKIDDREIPDAPGPLTRRLYALMEEILADRDPRFKEWLFPV